MRLTSLCGILLVALGSACHCGGGQPVSSPGEPPSPGEATEEADVRALADFAARAPARTRVLARLDLSFPFTHDTLWDVADAVLAELGAAGRPIGSFEECEIDRAGGIRIAHVAIAEPMEFVVEVQGSLSGEKLACLLGEEREDGRVVVEGFVVTDLATGGGIRIASLDGNPGAGAPRHLREPLEELATRYQTAIVASVGPSGSRTDVSIAQDDSITRFELHLPEPGAARLAGKWLEEALAEASRQDDVLAQVTARLDGEALIVESPISAAIPLAFKSLVLEPFHIPTGGMLPTILVEEHVFVAKGPLAGTAERGDLVAFRHDNGKVYLKRVVGVAGDEVKISSGDVWLNGEPVPSEKIRAGHRVMDFDPRVGLLQERIGALWSESLGGRDYSIFRDNRSERGDGAWDIPPGHAFVLGDNRDHSIDSRHFGPIDMSSIVGHAVVVWMSTDIQVRWERIGQILR